MHIFHPHGSLSQLGIFTTLTEASGNAGRSKGGQNFPKTHSIHGTEIGIFTYNEWLDFYGFSCRYIYNRPMDGMG